MPGGSSLASSDLEKGGKVGLGFLISMKYVHINIIFVYNDWIFFWYWIGI